MTRVGWQRRLAAVLVAAALFTPLAAALPPGAPGGPTGAAAATDAAVTVLIDQVSPSVLRPGQDLTVRATLRNESAVAIDGATAELRLYRVRPSSRAELEDWVAGRAGSRGSRVATAPVAIPPGGSVQVQLTVPAAQVGLLDRLGVWGPRGLAVEATAANGAELGVQRTFALWQPDEVVPQVRVSVLAPVTGVAGTDAEDLEKATGPGGRLRAVADVAAAERDVELAVDPALLATAREGGPNATAWSSQLTAATALRDTYALPWGDVDLAAVAHAGSADLLTTALDLSAQVGLEGTSARTDVLWAPNGELDAATAGAAASAGATALVVGPETLQVDDAVSTARVDLSTSGGALTALVPDGLLTQLLVDPTGVEAGATTATTVQRLLAEIAVLAHGGATEPHHVLLAPSREWSPDARHVSALLSALRTSPWSRLVPVSALLGAADDGMDRDTLPDLSTAGSELPSDRVQALAEARDATEAFAAAIGDTETLTAGLDQQVLAPLSVAWREDPAGRSSLVDTVLAHAEAGRTGLSVAPAANLNVISASASVRFFVRNDLSVPATVAVQVTPRKACLRPVRSEPVTAEPGTELDVTVELVAVANCDVVVDTTLVGANGQTVGEGMRFSARVAPTIEDVGTAVVGALLAVGLLLGIVRTVRRGQSARRGARRADEDAPPLPVLGGEVNARHGEGDE